MKEGYMLSSSYIKNEDIGSCVDAYRQTYKAIGKIVFQLKRGEYFSLSKITKSFRAAKKESCFDHEEWANKAKNLGLFSDDKAFNVFCFLATEWKSTTNIVTKEKGGYIEVEIMDGANLLNK